MRTISKRELFETYGINLDQVTFSKAAAVDEPATNINQSTLADKLEGMIDAMLMSAPTLDRQEAAHYLLHSPHGRRLYEHLSKTMESNPVPQQTDISKLIPIMEEALMAQAKLHKRHDESEAKAFSRFYESNLEYRKQWQTLTEAKHLQALRTTKALASLEPTSVVVDGSETSAAKAVAALTAMCEAQHKTFEQVFSDPANSKLAAATYSSAHRSSTTEYLEQ
jgi:hypothetical protein